MLSKRSSLSIASLRKLDEEANKFYDRKHDLYHTALLTQCYTQQGLRPYIDSEMNHIRHFIKIPSINKGIDFIDLPRIFRDNSVESSFPDYFENKEPPIICYKYKKTIRSTIFDFNKLITNLDIDTKAPDSCDCKNSKFCYEPAGHFMIGNLKIISDSRICSIISKSPKYRLRCIGYPSFIKDRIKLGSLQILALVQLQNFQNY